MAAHRETSGGMDWNAFLAGLGVIGGALLVFLLFVAITIFINRRRNRRLREAEELRGQEGSDFFTISSEDPPTAGVSLCSEGRVGSSVLTDLATTELSHVTARRRCPPLRKLNLKTIGVTIEGVTLDETTTDPGLLSRQGWVEFDRQQREYTWKRLQRQLAEELSEEKQAREREERAKARMMQNITDDPFSSPGEQEGLDQRLLTYLASTLLDEISTEEDEGDTADLTADISSA